MLMLAKIGLGIGGALAIATGYTVHQGMVRVAVDEHRVRGNHLHLVVPAALIPVAMRLAPAETMKNATWEALPWLPAIQRLAEELRKFPDAEFVEVRSPQEHILIHTQHSKLLVAVESPDETVNIACPLATIEQISEAMEKSMK